MKIIKILILSMIFLLSATGPVLAAGAAPYGEREVDGYKVSLTFADGNATVGHNQLQIQINDPQGQPVTNAKVSVIANLYTQSTAGMEGMVKAMNMIPVQTQEASLTVVPSSGEYEGEVDLSKAGNWMITVVVGLPQQEKSVDFAVEFGKSGPNWYVLSVFIGIITGTIVIGGLTKRKATTVANVSTPEVA